MKHRFGCGGMTTRLAAHRRYPRLILAGLLLLGIVSLLSSGQDPLSAAGRGLAVVEHGPSGQLNNRSDANTVHLTFDRPMVAEDLPADTVAGPLRIEPRVPGRYWWTGTRTLVYVADQPLPLSSRFTVTLPAGSVRAFDGTPLYQDFTFDFTTPRLKVERVETESPNDDLGLDEALVLVFSQAVAAAEVADNISLSVNGEGMEGFVCRHPTRSEMQDARSRRYGRWEGMAPGQVVIIEPSPAWPAGARLRLRLGRGLTGIEGTLGLQQDFTWQGTVAPPLVCRGLDDSPANHPYECLRLNFTSRVRPADVARALRLTPAVTIPASVYRETRASQSVIIPLALKPGATYRVELGNELRSVHKQQLVRAWRTELHVRDLPERFELMEGHVTLRPDQVRQLSVTVTNLDTLSLRMAKVNPEQFLGLKPFSWGVNRQWRLNSPRNAPSRNMLPVSELLPAAAHGFVRVEVQDPAGPGEAARDYQHQPRSIHLQVTSLGITGKFSPEGTLIWVTNLQGGAGVAGAEVALYSPGRGKLWSGRTGADGTAAAPGWNRWELGDTTGWDAPRLYVIASKGGEQAVLASDWNQGVEAWRFPVAHEYRGTARQLRGMLFTDRGIYRPGETMRLKGIMRTTTATGFALPAQRRISIAIRDGEGNEVHKAEATLSPRGGFDLSFRVPAAARLGEYCVTAKPLNRRPRHDDDYYYEEQVSGSFRVAEFRAASIKATVDLPAGRQFYGSSVEARLGGRALAGTALANRQVNYTATLTMSPPRPAGWDEFSFSPAVLADGAERGDDEEGDGREMQLAGAETQLDEQGMARVTVNPPVRGFGRGATAPANLTDGRLTVEATVQDLGEQRSSARAEVAVLRSDLMLGLRVPDAFKPEGAATRIEAIVLDREGKKVSGRTVNWQVVRRTWVSQRRANEGGELWVSRAKDEVIASGSATSADQAVGWTVMPATGGYYLVSATVADERGRAIQAAESFYVWGGGGSWWRENDDRVDVVADRAVYRPGETAKLILRSPFTSCRALVTTEREGVQSQRVIDLVGTSPMIEIPLTSAHVPNVYVGIVIINTSPNFREGSPVRLGLINLPVDPAERRLTVSVTPDQAEYEPGGRVTLTLRARDAAGRPAGGELTVAVVDEGVLQLVAHRFPDPIGVMFAERNHFVTTADIRTHLVDDRTLGEKGEPIGGDGGEGGGDAAAAWTRRNFDPTAVWKPGLALNASGEAKLTFTLPDAITTYRVLVLANGDGDRFGYDNETTFLARRQLALEPAFPRFVRPGDEFSAGVVVRNLSAPGSNVALSCAAKNIEIVGSEALTATVARGRDQLVQWQFRVPAQAAGNITLKFTARVSGSNAGDAIERVVTVVPPRVETLFATAGSLESSSVTEPLRFRPDASPRAGGLELQFSTTALVQLAGATDYLFTYPYGCLEQRTSCVAPILALGDIAADLGLKGLPGGRDEVKKIVREYLQQVPLYQNSDGGFSVWPGGGNSYPYLTALTVRTMLRAKKQGYAPDERCLNAATEYLVVQVRGNRERDGLPYDDRCWRAADAVALAALAECGLAGLADLDHAYRGRESLPLLGVAALYQAAITLRADQGMQLQLRRTLLNSLRLGSTTAHFSERDPSGLGWIYHSNVTATAAALEALMAGPQGFVHADKVARWLAQERKNGYWGSTRENAAVCEALAAYYRRYESAAPNLTALLAVPGQAEWTGTFRGRSTEIRNVNYGMAALLAAAPGDNLPVRLATRGPGRLYYEARVRGVVPESGNALDRGFAIERRLEKLDGTPVAPEQVRRGSTYRLRCFVSNRDWRLFVAADVPLPAGLEGIDLSLASEQQELARQLRPARNRSWWSGFGRTEIRDDRIAFYADQLPPGRHEVVALVRATAAGAFAWPGAHAEAMYEPEVMGRTAAATVTVRPD